MCMEKEKREYLCLISKDKWSLSEVKEKIEHLGDF